MDYPYRFLQEEFGCSPNTITAAKVHCILFGRGGSPPATFKFSRQCVSTAVLEELSEFFMRDNVSRPSSCRSIMVDNEETPVRYWKDSIKNLVNQTKAKVLKSQQYMKTQFSKHTERHSPCLELCMSHAFGSCSESQPSCCPDVVGLLEVEKYVKETLPRIANAAERDPTNGRSAGCHEHSYSVCEPSPEDQAPGRLQIHPSQSPAR
ncbi:hypothetical protein OS493_020839 [Desmophyllum pertusum]|uniref:Uncharacterized protein n=1 Tax=Desmophyllum pertusum TaxID=174260 RepID=A0A9X0CG81_9CNID|nr:hypothetical protein OS493_020839 [Desmophyllum pertusum]